MRRSTSSRRYTQGAFILTSDGKREKVGRPVALCLAAGDLSSEGLARLTLTACMPRSPAAGLANRSSVRNDGGKTWEPVGKQVRVRRRSRHSPVV